MTDTIITHSTELMRNFQQAEVVGPGHRFEALQSDSGLSVLFSTGTDGIFYATLEVPGEVTGWKRFDVSGAIPPNGDGTPAKTKSFAVAEDEDRRRIHLAIAIDRGEHDELYLAVDKPSDNLAWLSAPGWVHCPYDGLRKRPRLVICDVFLSYATGGQHVVVDVLRDPQSASKQIFRYFIHPASDEGEPAWQPTDVSADIDAWTMRSCTGRPGQNYDGIYTLGKVGEHAQLVFQPFVNPFEPDVAPTPTRLEPPGLSPTALAAATVDSVHTALFVASDGKLFCFPADGQHADASAVQVIDDPLLVNVKQLYAYSTPETMVVWGLNGAQEVFYAKCDRGRPGEASAWSVPVPIVTNAEQISPYVGTDASSTFFAHTGAETMRKLIQTTRAWTSQEILLPPPQKDIATEFDSYTTRVQVTDSQRQPLAAREVQLTTDVPARVFIDNRYYVLGAVPTRVSTDAAGAVVIVQRLTNLQGSEIAVASGEVQLVIDPMRQPMLRMGELMTRDGLRNATIHYQSGDKKSLVDPQTEDRDLDVAAIAVGKLVKAYNQVKPADADLRAIADLVPQQTAVVALRVDDGSLVAGNGAGEPLDIVNAITLPAGDLLRWLASAASYAVDIVEHGGAWHFVATILGKAYAFVLDSASAIVGALEVVFKAIKTTIDDVVAYLRYVFAWEDITRTQRLFKKILLLDLNHKLEQVDKLGADFGTMLQDARAAVGAWSGVKDGAWKSALPNHDKPPGYMRALADVEHVLTAPAMFLAHHLADNLRGAVMEPVSASSNVSQEVLEQAEKDVLGGVLTTVTNVRTQLLDASRATTMTLEQVLETLIGIVVDAMLNMAAGAMNALFDVFQVVARAAVKALDTPIQIPVVSAVLKHLGAEVNVSLLDVLCYAGAIPATIAYKLEKKSAPFSAGDGFSEKILNAPDVGALREAFKHPEAPDLADKETAGFIPIELPADAQKIIFITGHVLGGAVGLLGAVLSTADAMSQDKGSPYGMAAAVAGAVSGIMGGVAGVLATPYPIKDPVVAKIGTVTNGLTLTGKLVFWIAPHAIAKARGLPDNGERKSLDDKVGVIGSGFCAAIALIDLAPTCFHFYELSALGADRDRSEAIVGEVAKVCTDLARITTFAVVVDREPDSKAVLAGIMGTLLTLAAGLEIANSLVESGGRGLHAATAL
jgi:hypothetical protein